MGKNGEEVSMYIEKHLRLLRESLPPGVTLVAVSKTHPLESILRAYNEGQRIFGENKVQELVAKADQAPSDIEWHLLGHLQRNKIRAVLPYVSLIHSVDSLRLLESLSHEAEVQGRVVDCLLQVHIAQEETKYGFPMLKARALLLPFRANQYPGVRLRGLMGMATNTPDSAQVAKEFRALRDLFREVRAKGELPEKQFNILSMGMSGDYKVALRQGSTMVRIGSGIFGVRD